MIYKFLVCLIIICSIASGLGGMYTGYKLGKDAICTDIAFYYNNDVAIKNCKVKSR